MSVQPRSASSASLAWWECNGPGSGTVMPGRTGSAMTADTMQIAFGRARGDATGRVSVVLPEAHDHALAGRRQQGSVLGEHVDEAVSEATGHGMDADVHQHPLGRYELHHAQRVVEAVPPGEQAEALADPHRHEVTEHGERWRVDAGHHIGKAGPQQGLAVAR